MNYCVTIKIEKVDGIEFNYQHDFVIEAETEMEASYRADAKAKLILAEEFGVEIKQGAIIEIQNIHPVRVYKHLKNFTSMYINENGEYEIYDLPRYIIKSDFIYCDLCIFQDKHTYIRGYVVRRYKRKSVLKFEYV